MSDHIELLKKLLKVLEKTDVAELTFEENGIKIQLKRASAEVKSLPLTAMLPALAPPAPLPTPEPIAVTPSRASNYISVTSPFVGTFYRAPAPSTPAFVQEGQEVRPGNVLCIVEAMKLMNELECDSHARIAKILVENGRPVEFGQELFLLEPLN